MQSSLLALFKFTICSDYRCSQNLHTFAVVLHNLPLKVEKTELFSLVKRWKSLADVEAMIQTPSISLPPALPPEEAKTTSVRFFSQSYYKSKGEEKGRLLCWGECKQSRGAFSFVLP